ncbi:MAG: dihydrofolate reductase [Pseudomonadales bacterium]|nr:dihydrofolate reductase [Pseudomonadales bacterium]
MAMRIALIWAMARNRVIGRDNDLPWHLPKDLKHFMRTTVGHPVIMGRRTFESMNAPLPQRTNIVVTRNPDYRPAGALVAADLDSALALARAECATSGKDTIFIAGGAEIYRLGLEIATHLIVTEIDAEFAGDTFFPEVDWSAWREVSCEDHAIDAEHAWPFSIRVLERR